MSVQRFAPLYGFTATAWHHELVSIRRAETADAQALARVHVRTWQEAYRGLMPQDYLDSLDVARWRSGWDRVLEAMDWPRTGVLVAEDHDEVVGFVYFGPSRDDGEPTGGEIYSIYAVPGVWGQGVGRELMAAGLAALADAGFAEASLWVLDTNTRARRFYEAGGWTVDEAGRTLDLRGFSVCEVRYRRPPRA